MRWRGQAAKPRREKPTASVKRRVSGFWLELGAQRSTEGDFWGRGAEGWTVQSTEGSRLQPGGNREPQSGLIQQERDGQHVFAVHRHCQAALPKRAGAGFIRLWPVQPAQRKSPRRESLNDYRVTRWRTGDFWTHSYGISCLYI